jgi:tetratricopeptide (TPR) repeat protein
VPRRPALKAAADTNDWMEYQQYAMSIIVANPGRAADALYWAERLDPTRAEPTMSRWAALWMLKPQLLADYWQGSEKVRNSPAVRRLDSLNYAARLRDPMVNQAVRLLVVQTMINRLAGRENWEWNREPEVRAWLDYTRGDFARAAAELATVIKRNPEKHHALRYTRALALAAMQEFDSAAAELTHLVAEMHRRDEKEIVYFYNSKAMFEYATAVMHVEARKLDEARQAFMRALTEDLAFYPAHRGLAALSLGMGDTAMAITEYQQALELQPHDVVTRYYFALLLMNVRRRDEAIEHLQAVVEAEPYFPLPYYYLGRLLETRGREAEALAHYSGFVSRAPRSQAAGIAVAQGRIAALAAAGVVAAPLRRPDE